LNLIAMKPANLLLILGLLLGLMACDNDRNLPELGEPFEVLYSGTATVSPTLSVNFFRLTEDSRCPDGAECITAGKVTVQLRADVTGAGRRTLDLTLDPAAPELAKAAWEGYVFELLEVSPYPQVGETYEPTDYSLRLLIDRQ
jgi:hypothetical protein